MTDDKVHGHEAGRGGIVVVAGAAVLLLLAWVIGLGVAGPNENRVRAAFPPPTADYTSPGTFAQVDAAVRDRIPLRPVVLDGIASGLGWSPLTWTDRVQLGGDGIPYLSDDFFGPCRSGADLVPGVLETVDARAAALADQGKYGLFVIAPDKSSIWQNRLGAAGPRLMSCSNAVRDALEKQASGTSMLTVWDDLESAQARSSVDLYRPGDTHWNTVGASVFVRSVLKRLAADGEAPQEIVSQVRFDRTTGIRMGGDLYNFLAQTRRTDLVPAVSPQRTGVTTAKQVVPTGSGRGATRWKSVSEGPALVPGRTLVIGDSFFEAAGDVAAPYFQDLTLVVNLDANSPPPQLDTSAYDRVIVEQVQRGWNSIADEFALADKVASSPR